MCAFVPRYQCPNPNSPWWTSTARGGMSPCIHDSQLKNCAWTGATISNCVGYAWGRFSEILGRPMSPAGAPNAGEWFSSYATGYPRGQTPAVGAVGCFSKPGEAGHVLIVEAVYPDGSIQTSESSYSGSAFFSQRRYPPNYMNAPYQFQGFIYNPNADMPASGGYFDKDLSQFTDFTGFDLKARLGDVVYQELLKLGMIVTYQIGNVQQELLRTDQINKYIYSNMYKSYNTRNDAIGREAGYWDMAHMKPSIFSTSHKLSAMNYTPLLEDVWNNVRETFTYYQIVDAEGNKVSDKFGRGMNALDSGYIPTEISISTSALSARPRITIEFLIGKGLSPAGACGIAGNIDAESGFRTNAVGDNGTSFGICQWHNNRGSAMKDYCNRFGGDWSNNLTGQLEYLWYELTHVSDYGLSNIRCVQNTLEGAKQAADIFVRKFERPSNVDHESVKRQNNAERYWNSIVRYL